MQMILFTGIPGSGKSTFYQRYFFHTHLRVNLDQLRTRNRENKLLRFCFQTRMPFVVDNTNVRIADRLPYIAQAQANAYAILGYYFDVDLRACLERNQTRSGKLQIPERGVIAKYRQLQEPTSLEGFTELYRVQLVNQDFLVLPWSGAGPNDGFRPG